MRRWRAKNPRPQRPNDQPLNQDRQPQTSKKPQQKRDGKSGGNRGNRVAAVARAAPDSDWFTLLSFEGEPSGHSDCILDSGANVSVVNSLTDMEEVKSITPVKISGIGSDITATQSGTHKLFGECFYAPECRFNLISQQRAAERYSVFFDSDAGNLYTLTPKDQTANLPVMTFVSGADRLYHMCHDLTAAYGASFRHDTPRDSRTPRTQEELHKAKGVLDLHAGLNHPSDDALSKLLNNGGIIGCPWTSRDLRLARSIFGDCVKCRVGKTANPIAPPSQSPGGSSPGKLLHADIFFVTSDRGLKFPYLISLDDTVNYMMVVKVKSRQVEHLLEAFTQMANAYKSYGWRVRVIRTDQEALIRAIEPNLNGLGIQCKYTGRGMHERRAERAIRVIKKRVRILRCTQVYKLPARLNEAAVIDIVMTLNITPNKRSGTRSPREVVTGKKVNAPKDIRIEFGQLV